MVPNFVTADLTNGTNHIVFYDERAQGKGADALCSLSLRYHMRLLRLGGLPDILFLILDNCVG